MKLNKKVYKLQDDLIKNENHDFPRYLIMIGSRMNEFQYSLDIIMQHIDYLKLCHQHQMSAYKALLFLDDRIKTEYTFECERWKK